tara:strand:- start:420 stop:545 length:126 start_codon:yes stop_codon:yes gene_type:complete
MTLKTNKKRTVETINIKLPTSEILVTYALFKDGYAIKQRWI